MSDVCAVCAQVCGPLRGKAKSWRCAGLLAAHNKSLRVVKEQTEARFTGEGKDWVRETVVSFVSYVFEEPREILDMWGGGASARAFRQAFPDAHVVSVERDPALALSLEADARRHGYTGIAGDLKDVGDGRSNWDFAWFDMCGPISATLESDIGTFCRKARRLGGAALTVMPEREADEFLVRSRSISIPAWFMVLTGLPLSMVIRYRRPTGHEMWLLAGAKGFAAFPDWLHGECFPAIELSKALNSRGQWFSDTLTGMVRPWDDQTSPSPRRPVDRWLVERMREATAGMAETA